MKAIYFEKHGGPEVLRYGDIPTPEPAVDNALIRVRYAALNHLDIWVRRGWKGLSLTMPHVTGSDILGEIASLPSSCRRFKEGDTVLVNPGVSLYQDKWTKRGEMSLSPGYRVIGEHMAGGLAECVRVPLTNIFPVADTYPEPALASLPVVAQTCWRMLKTLATITPQDSVLIVGAGGGVNSLAVQLCKSFGCHTIVLAGSAAKAEKALSLGADKAIEYNAVPDWHREVLAHTEGEGVSVVIDNVGQATFEKSLKSLCPGGKLLTVGNTSGPTVQIDNRMIFAKQLQIIGSTMGSEADFTDSIAYIIEHAIVPIVDTLAPLSNGIEQMKRLESGEQFGKIVLDCR